MQTKLALCIQWPYGSKSELFPESESVSVLEEAIAIAMVDERDTFREECSLLTLAKECIW